MQLYWPTGPAARVLPWRTSVPARFWNSSATCSAMWPIHVPSRSRVMKPPRRPSEQAWSSSVGSSATSASVKFGRSVRRVTLEDAEVDQQPDDRLARPVVRAAQDARLEDAQRRRGLRRRARPARGATPAWSGASSGPRCRPRVSSSAGWWRHPARASSTRPRRRAVRAGSVSRRARDGGDRSDSRPAANGARRR